MIEKKDTIAATLALTTQGIKTMQKQATIAETMRQFMASGPSVKGYPTYKALNDAVGAVHGLEPGKCQALAGPKAWAWTADQTTGVWRKATDVEIESRRQKAAEKNHGTRRSKVMSDADRAALEAQIDALIAVNNPALAPLLDDLRAQQASDDAARKGSLKDRLAAAVERLGLARAVDLLEAAAAEDAEMAEDGTPEDGTPEAAEMAEDGTPEDGTPEAETPEAETPEAGRSRSRSRSRRNGRRRDAAAEAPAAEATEAEAAPEA